MKQPKKLNSSPLRIVRPQLADPKMHNAFNAAMIGELTEKNQRGLGVRPDQ
jgi:hypothetical protein